MNTGGHTVVSDTATFEGDLCQISSPPAWSGSRSEDGQCRFIWIEHWSAFSAIIGKVLQEVLGLEAGVTETVLHISLKSQNKVTTGRLE